MLINLFIACNSPKKYLKKKKFITVYYYYSWLKFNMEL